MTEHLPTDRLPDAPFILPTEVAVGHGYVVETGENAVTLTLLHNGTRPFNVAMPLDLATLVAGRLLVACTYLRKLSNNEDDETEEDNAE